MNQNATIAVAARSDSLRGIACLVLGIAVFALQDVVIKKISGVYPLHEAMVLRSIAAFPVLLLLVWRDGGFATLTGPGWPWLLIRGTVAFMAYSCYYLGLAALPIATAVALYFAAPLFITVLSVLFLGERVGARRWAAVVIGFLGVVTIVRPGTALFDWASLLPITAAFLYAVAMVLTRRIGGSETAPAMSTWGNFVFLVGALALSAVFGSGSHDGETHRSLAFLMRGWVQPNPRRFRADGLLRGDRSPRAHLVDAGLSGGRSQRRRAVRIYRPHMERTLRVAVLAGMARSRRLGRDLNHRRGRHLRVLSRAVYADRDQARAVSACAN